MGASRTAQLWVVAGLMVIVSTRQAAWFSFIPTLQARMSAAFPDARTLFLIVIGSSGLLAPLMGIAVDRTSPRRSAALGAVLAGLGWAGASVAPGPIALYVVFGVVGAAGSNLMFLAGLSHVARWYADRRGFAIGVVLAAGAVGASVVAALVAFQVEILGASVMLLVLGALTTGAGLLLCLGLQGEPPPLADVFGEADPGEPAGPARVRDVIGAPFWTWALVAVALLSASTLHSIHVFPFLREASLRDGTAVGVAVIGLLSFVERLCAAAGSVLLGGWSDRAGRTPVFARACTVAAAALLCLGLLPSGIVAAAIASGVAVSAMAAQVLITAAVADLCSDPWGSPRAQPTGFALGLLVLAGAIAYVVASRAEPSLLDGADARSAFLAGAGLCLAAALLATLGLRPPVSGPIATPPRRTTLPS